MSNPSSWLQPITHYRDNFIYLLESHQYLTSNIGVRERERKKIAHALYQINTTCVHQIYTAAILTPIKHSFISTSPYMGFKLVTKPDRKFDPIKTAVIIFENFKGKDNTRFLYGVLSIQ